MAKFNVNVSLDDEVVKKVDNMRGIASRSGQINQLLRQALELDGDADE